MINQEHPLQQSPQPAGKADDPQPLPQGNSGSKKSQKKQYSKRQQDPSSQEQLLTNKYKDIHGVADWMQMKRAEAEKGGNVQHKKGTMQMLSSNIHAWRPPRIDSNRYQTERLPTNDDV